MDTIQVSQLNRIRVLALLITLMFSAVALPVGLVYGDADGCGMVHCEEDGECCCLINLEDLKERQANGAPIAGAPEIRTGCPVNCCTTGGTITHSSPDSERSGRKPEFGPVAGLSATHGQSLQINSLPRSVPGPRGPPVLSN